MIIDLPKEVQNTFAAIAEQKNITQELLAKEAIMEWIQDFEDAREADNARKEFMQSPEVILADEAYKELGLK
ncbi:DUF6290 family protein [Helicobacter sp. 23-1048]